MTSVQYEELCRFFVSKQLGIPVELIESVRIPNSKRGDLPQYHHQIDLYWETEDNVSLYLNIANAKWRGTDKVDQPEVLLLQQVKQKVAAHKAVVITNSGFTSGAEAAAKDDGIALQIVRPSFDISILHRSDRAAIQSQLHELHVSHAVFEHQMVHKGFDLPCKLLPPGPPAEGYPLSYPTTVPNYVKKTPSPYFNRDGGGSRGPAGQSGGPGGSATKGSGGPGFWRK